MSSQIKKAERRALPGAQASPEGPAQGWGPISPRMSAAPEPSHKAKKKKAPEGADGFRHFCVSQDEGQYLWNSKRSSTNGVNRSWRPVKDCQSLAKNRERTSLKKQNIYLKTVSQRQSPRGWQCLEWERHTRHRTARASISHVTDTDFLSTLIPHLESFSHCMQQYVSRPDGVYAASGGWLHTRKINVAHHTIKLKKKNPIISTGF